MREQRLFDLDRIDVESAGDDHVLGAIDDVQEVVRVEIADVARVMPAERRGLGRRIGILVVALHDQRAAHDDFAALASRQQMAVPVHDPDFDERRRPAGGRQPLGRDRPVRAIVIGRRERRHHHRRLGLSEQLCHRADPFERFGETLGRNRRGAVPEALQRIETGGRQVRMIEQHVDHRRRQKRVRDAFALDRRKKRADVGVAHHDDRPAQRQDGQTKHAGRMRQRRERQIDRPPVERIAHQRECRHRLQVPLRQHHALRHAGRTARARQHRDVGRRLAFERGVRQIA